MAAEPSAVIDELLSLTDEMFSLASAGQWDAVQAHEILRVTAMESLGSLGDDTDSEVTAKLRLILNRNAEIVALAFAEKNKIADELKHFKNLEKANQAYRDIDNRSA